jgi:hypothetical protein
MAYSKAKLKSSGDRASPKLYNDNLTMASNRKPKKSGHFKHIP